MQESVVQAALQWFCIEPETALGASRGCHRMTRTRQPRRPQAQGRSACRVALDGQPGN